METKPNSSLFHDLQIYDPLRILVISRSIVIFSYGLTRRKPDLGLYKVRAPTNRHLAISDTTALSRASANAWPFTDYETRITEHASTMGTTPFLSLRTVSASACRLLR